MNEKEVIRKRIDYFTLEIIKKTGILNEYQERKNKLESDYNANNYSKNNLNYKINYLENSINNNETIPSSVRNIKNNIRLTGVHDVIANLMEIENEYKLAISTSLGGASSYLVVEDTDVAKNLVKYLKDNNLGRATFYPLNVIEKRYVDSDTLSNLKNMEGFIDVASNLITYDKKYYNIMQNVLGNVIVCNNIDNATTISKNINNRYKIVTLDGQVINVGGSITGGSKIKTNNVILQKYELEECLHNLNNLEAINNNLLADIHEITLNINRINSEINELNIENNKYNDSINSKDNLVKVISETLTKLEKEISDLELINSDNADNKEQELLQNLYQIKEEINGINHEIEVLNIDKNNLENDINALEETSKNSNSYILKQEKIKNNEEIKLNRIDVKLDNLLLELTESYNMTYDYAKTNYHLEIDSEEARSLVANLKDKLNKIGVVNLGSIEEFERVSQRYDFLTKQKDDLEKATTTLLEIIDEMDLVMKDNFIATFNEIKQEFKNVFRDLFHGGDAELVLTDPGNILETGIEIKAEPPGKKLQSLSLLSGGEKTFTAISLLFAILNVRPVAFCVLDEVEAALDEANVLSFGEYLRKYKDKTQFILITHKKKTMEYADILYGITMQESGVSKLVSVKLEDIKE